MVVSRHASHLWVYGLAAYLVKIVCDASCSCWVDGRVMIGCYSYGSVRQLLLFMVDVLLDNRSKTLLRLLVVLILCCKCLWGCLGFRVHTLNVNRLLNHSSSLIGHDFRCTATNNPEVHILRSILIRQNLQRCPCCGLLRFIKQVQSILIVNIIHNWFLIIKSLFQFHLIQRPCCLLRSLRRLVVVVVLPWF